MNESEVTLVLKKLRIAERLRNSKFQIPRELGGHKDCTDNLQG